MTTREPWKLDRVEPVQQPELFDPVHMSYQTARLRFSHHERIYLQHWRKLNERLSYVNNGFTYLEWILCPSRDRWPGPVTQRDAAVAASIMQWLGTNCGHSFLRTAEAAIERETRAKEEPRQVFPVRLYGIALPGQKIEAAPTPRRESTRNYGNDY